MIHYALRCAAGHDFDGWFRGLAAFEAQEGAGLLACPLCASTEVSRAPMAPRLSSGARAPAVPAPEAPKAPAAEVPAVAARAMPDQVRAMLQRVRAEVERRCDYVGPAFAQAARDMHDGRQEPRPIYGETTPAEAEALAEDGIEVSSIPWLPRAES